MGAAAGGYGSNLFTLLKPSLIAWNLFASEQDRIPENAEAYTFGLMLIHGSERFPSVPISMTGFSDVNCFQVAVGLDVGGGWLEALGDPPPPGESMVFEPGEARHFDLSAHPSLEGGVFFETNGFTLSPGGVQYLREFAAENRALFIGEKSRIEVNGYTDTTGTMNDNLILSQNRADAVKCVLKDLLGAALKVPIDAVGFGEGPAAAAIGQVPDQTPAGVNDALFRRADVVVGGHIVASIQTR